MQPATPEPVPVNSPSGAGRLEPVLGRSVIVRPGQTPPAAWERCERAGGSVEELEAAWRERRPLVIEAAADPAEDEVNQRPVWSLSPSFAFPGERMAHAMSANAVDARSSILRWRWADEAIRLGARPGGPADVVLGDGRPALCDGGPTEWLEVPDVAVIPRLSLLGGSISPLGDNTSDALLAPDQRAAVLHAGAAARIIAPAGSGKTRVLTERARHLLRGWNVPGRTVTLLAFNKRAADEMLARTSDLPDLQVRTLNAIGLSLVNRSQRATTIDEREVRAILDSLVDLPRRANTDPAAAWIEALSAVRLGLQDPLEVQAEFGGDVDGLPEVLDRYRQVLSDRRVVDFDEQIYRSIEILLTEPSVRKEARAGCRLLLVDEFQDLTPAHLLLIRLLAGPEGAVFGVGDDDQTIYGYSGASPAWLIEYRRYFPSAGEHSLEINYRCPTPVVAAARTLLTHNRRRVDKRILAPPERADGQDALCVTAGHDALAGTQARIDELVDRGVAPGEIAVLTRVNASLAPVQVALLHHGIPVRKAIDETYLARGGVQAALAWLRLATKGRSGDGHDGRDVALAARRPSRALSPKVVEWMSEQGSVPALRRLASRMNSRDAAKILDFVADLEIVQDAAVSATTSDVLRTVRDRVGLDAAMHLLEGARRRVDRSAQTDDLDALVALAALHPDPHGFEDWLRDSLRRPGDVNGVALATIHAVKGREWKHVIVFDVRAGLLPHRLASDVEEERRVFHVAITRGSVSVTIVAGDPPSPFLSELTEPWTPARVPVRAAARATAASPAAGPEFRPEATIVAATGVDVEHGGHRGPIVLVDADGALLEIGEATVRVAYGSMVRVDGRLFRLVPQPVPAAVVERAREALRAWRLARSRSLGKPAYVVFSDATLDALATTLPANMGALSRIKGIGPAKLDAYGDEVLTVLDSVRPR